MSEKHIRHPIEKTVIAGSIAFVFVLCIVLSLASYRLLQVALTERYKDKFNEILTYTESLIDAEDLKECIRTEQPSEKYSDLQKNFDIMLDDFELDHLYCVVASNTQIWNVVTAESKKDLEEGKTHKAINEAYGFFPQKELQRYVSFWRNDDISYFEELTWSGLFYTAARPVKDSEGKTIALLCIDVSVDTIADLLRSYIVPAMIAMVLICLIFLILLIAWLRSRVTRPLGRLEESVRNYAGQSHRLRDIKDLRLDLPDIHTGNEVESLGKAIVKMSIDMQDYVMDIVTAEARAESAEHEAEDMTVIAYRDALTKVKSKAAFDIKVAELEKKIGLGEAEFAFVMVDLNNLKAINDNFGHDRGDEYIIGSCRQICSAFSHSPVYRIGGDEFLAVLEGEDYADREERFKVLTEAFAASRANEDAPLWNCYSAAGGMAAYSGAPGETVEDVRRHADVAMYEDKQLMKTMALKGEIVDRCSSLPSSRS